MRIYPINQSAVMFRGSNNNQQHKIKRYCEPRTGAYYYYDATQYEQAQQSLPKMFKNLANKFSNFSKSIKSFAQESVNSSNNDDTLWL
jgi:hypothetical protein